MNKAVGFPCRARAASIFAAVMATGLLLVACGSSSSSSSSATSSAAAGAGSGSSSTASTSSSAGSGAGATKHLKIAYLSFAVANSYDAPMLAAAQKAAAAGNASLTVFDAANDPNKQFSEFQNALTTGGYDGVITQPIESTNLIPLVQQALAKHIAVVNIDQILGPKLNTFAKQVPGLSGNVTFVPDDMGTKLGKLVVQACTTHHLNPCKIGYLYDIKASALDVAIRNGFNAAVASSPSVKIVAEGQDLFTPAGGLKATQDMLQAQPSLNLIAGSDQGIEGATQGIGSKQVVLVGYGGSAAGLKGVASGQWYGTVAQDPASEGRTGIQELIAAIRTGTAQAAVNPLDALPAGGVITKANASQFHAEWPG